MAARAATTLILAIGVVGCRFGHPPAYSARAVGALRAASDALGEYRAACGAYPATLEMLRLPKDPSIKRPTCTHFAKLDDSVIAWAAAGLAPPDDQPYALLYAPAGPTTRGFERYRMEARWLGRDGHELTSFWTSDAGVFRVATDRPANEHDEPLR